MSSGPGQDIADIERDFWNLQESRLDELYARPHDWRFIPKIADIVMGPRNRYIQRLVARLDPSPQSFLDIGCGNGWLGLELARAGRRCIGVDVSDQKIARARETARAEGLEHLCRFEAADITRFESNERVDALISFGSLHHLPNLSEELPRLVERHLKPGGWLIFVEPHHEGGMSPRLSRFVFWWPQRRLFKGLFDAQLYHLVHGGGHAADAVNIRDESPAGKLFFGDHPSVADTLKAQYGIIEERYFLTISGHLANAFYTFVRNRPLRWLTRTVLPFIAWLDTRLCRNPRHQRYAEEGLWLARDPRR